MFAPTKTWRRWHRKINVSQKRYAVASALAASAVPALVMARGHKIDDVPEIPLVLDTSLESAKKTSAAKDILAAVGALADVEKAADSKKIRAGKGKARNRKYVLRRGPLVIYKTNDGVEQAFRNLPGVELCCVDRLNLLQLAPGGHMGRFCVWSQAALDALNEIYGSEGKSIPEDLMANADLARIINSDEIQSVLNPAKSANKIYLRKKNPLTSIKALAKLDPYAAAARESERRAEEARKDKKAETLKKRREVAKSKMQYRAAGKAYYEKVSKQGDVCSEGFMVGKI
jgi:large subunit ribosomal protein L4e